MFFTQGGKLEFYSSMGLSSSSLLPMSGRVVGVSGCVLFFLFFDEADCFFFVETHWRSRSKKQIRLFNLIFWRFCAGFINQLGFDFRKVRVYRICEITYA